VGARQRERAPLPGKHLHIYGYSPPSYTIYGWSVGPAERASSYKHRIRCGRWHISWLCLPPHAQVATLPTEPKEFGQQWCSYPTVNGAASLAQVVAAAEPRRAQIVQAALALAGDLEREGSPLAAELAVEIRNGAPMLGAANTTCASPRLTLTLTLTKTNTKTNGTETATTQYTLRACVHRCAALASQATRLDIGASLQADITRSETYKPPDPASNWAHDSRAYAARSTFTLLPIGALYFQANKWSGHQSEAGSSVTKEASTKEASVCLHVRACTLVAQAYAGGFGWGTCIKGPPGINWLIRAAAIEGRELGMTQFARLVSFALPEAVVLGPRVAYKFHVPSSCNVVTGAHVRLVPRASPQ
jgi:hypothetical protein